MRRRHDVMAALTVLGLVAAGCAGDGKGAPAEDPNVEGKADFMNQVTVQGELDLVEVEGRLVAEASATFAEDFEYHGYRLMTREETELRIEVTQRGSSRNLDTTLYVYGPRGDNGYEERLGFDDDEGWGKLSALDSFVAPADGEYLIVVGTYSGLGRGNYRLEAECVTGDCLDVEVPTTCPERVETDIHDCVEEWLAEGDYEDTRHEAFVACTTDYAGDFYDYACDSSYHAPEPWCPAGLDTFMSEIMPACREAVGLHYPEDRDPLTLVHRDISAEIDERVDGASDWSMGARAESYTVQPPESGEEVTLEWVLDSVRQGSEQASMYGIDGGASLASFGNFVESYSLGDDFVDLLENDAGSDDFSLGSMSANWYCAAGAECWADLFVFHFDNGVVTTLEFLAGED